MSTTAKGSGARDDESITVMRSVPVPAIFAARACDTNETQNINAVSETAKIAVESLGCNVLLRAARRNGKFGFHLRGKHSRVAESLDDK